MTISHENLPLTLEEVVEPHFALATAPPASGPAAVLALMAQAVEKGMAVETMRALQEMYHAEQDRAARLEFAQALANFQEQCPPVPADAELEHLSRVDKAGVKRVVRFATIQGLRDWIHPHLSSNGFSLSLDAETDGDGGMLTGIATLRHINGHAESSRFKLPTAAKTPAMSPQQAYEAAYSFACRIALRSVTGVRVSADDEKAAAEMNPTPIDEGQIASLESLIEEVQASRAKVLEYASKQAGRAVAALADIRVVDYPALVSALEQRRKKP